MGAKRNPQRVELLGETRRVWLQRTNADGVVDKQVVFNDVYALISGRPDLLDIAKVVRDAVERVDKEFQPKADGVQATMFDPGAYLPIGQGERIVMSKATPVALARWWSIQVQEFAASSAAQSRKAAYYASRVQAWQPHHDTLADVERDVFGWHPSS